MQHQALRAGRVPGTIVVLAAVVLGLALFRPAYAVAPVITNLSPSSGPVAGGNPVVITGNNFTNSTTVTFDTTSVTPTVTNAGLMSVVAPAHAAGVVTVTIANGADVATTTYTYLALPTITLLNPNTGGTAGGNTVVITGTGFTGATSVMFGATSAVFAVGNDTTITATAPAHIEATVDVRVTAPGGTSANTAADDYAYVAPVPTLTGLNPTSGLTTGGTVVTVTGTGFTGATGVMFGAVPGTSVSVLNDTTLTVLSPAEVAGTVDVVVTTAGGDTATSAASKFTYTTVAAPTVTAVTPTSGSTAGGTTVVITGTNLLNTTSVTFGGVPGTGLTANTATSVTVTTPAHVAGTVDVVVTTTGGGSSAVTAASQFTYAAASAPTVTDVTPGGGPVAGGTSVTITGTNFTGATAVTFGGTSAVFTVVNSTTITATSPLHTAGLVDVLVTTPAGTSAVSTDAKFLYGPAPVVISVSPTSGTAGTVVTITGTGFTGATSVLFGDVSATPTSVTDTSITVTAPTHAAGAVNVQVVTPTGTSAVVTGATFTFAGSTITYTLNVRWSLIVWQGTNGMSIAAALKGLENPDNPATNDVSGRVTAIFRWDGATQTWKGYFPGSENVPGANDFTTFTKGEAYWIAINGSSAVTWTVLAG